MRTKQRRTVAAAIGISAAMLILSACGSDGNDTAATASTPSSTASAMTASGEPFGSGCAAVPTSGSGSFTGMSADPVATAASNNPLLSTLVTAVGKADLGATLNGAEALTVFAPVNDAFAAVPEKDLTALLADKAMLAKVLTYHVVAGQLTPEQLAGTHKTLEGSDLTVAGSGDSFTVNDTAKVICGNVKTANATVYLIDGVLSPPMS